MKRTYEEKSHQPITSVKSTTLNLQPRGFASPQAALAEDVSSQTNQVSSENLLEKIISTPTSESSTTPIQRKPQNRLKAMRSQRMEIQAKQNDESSVESNLASIHRKPQNRLKAITAQGIAIQAKLNIGEPNDKYEQEADDTASKVVQQINSPTQDKSVQKQESMEEEDELQMKSISNIQREESMEEEDELQMKSLVQKRENFGGGEASTDLESSIQSARGSGQSLDTGLQAKMGQSMGADFSDVKVHTDSQSDQLNKSIQAKAFTTGQDVFFRQGAYDPSSRGGQELIAHELTHVVQQNPVASVNRRMIRRSASKKVLQSCTDINVQPKLLVTAAKFKVATPKGSFRNKRSKELTEIDTCLKKIEQTGEDIILMSELLEAIKKWQAKAKPTDSRYDTVEALRKHVANEVGKLSKDPANVNPDLMVGPVQKPSADFSDFDSKQFRVSGRAPTRKIEEVKRTQEVNGDIVYYATGLVTGFDGKVPVIRPYTAPISLGNWYPTVTHINGMAVAPKGGILSAAALQESVNNALEAAGTDMSVAQNVVDLLYTYSALRGGTMGDLWDCIKGKVEMEDDATLKQEEIMLDAVRREQRVTVSAHSRGTIKTDNAVRVVHKILAQEFIPVVQQSADNVRRVQAYCQYAYEEAGILPDAMAAQCYKVLAAEKAKEDMNKFVQLIYAGNAVQHPSRFIDISIYVGGMDPVSMFVGTYSETGRKVDAFIGTGGSKKSKLHSVGKGKGHGFVGNYMPEVSQEIASDIRGR